MTPQPAPESPVAASGPESGPVGDRDAQDARDADAACCERSGSDGRLCVGCPKKRWSVFDATADLSRHRPADAERLHGVQFIHAGCKGLCEKDNEYRIARLAAEHDRTAPTKGAGQ